MTGMVRGEYPSNPTKGWLYGELDRLGDPCRGRGLTEAQLRARLRLRGYVFRERPASAADDAPQR